MMTDMNMAPEPSLRCAECRACSTAKPAQISLACSDWGKAARCAGAADFVARQTPAQWHQPSFWHITHAGIGVVRQTRTGTPAPRHQGRKAAPHGGATASIGVAFGMPPLMRFLLRIEAVTMVLHLAAPGSDDAAKVPAVAKWPLQGGNRPRTRLGSVRLTRKVPTADRPWAASAVATWTEDRT
ncbi:MAG TPA: hypothetical protein VIQ29_25045 [Ancylobacter sp.]